MTGASFYSFTDYSAKDSSMHLTMYSTFTITWQIMVAKSNKYMHAIIVFRKPWLQRLAEDRFIYWRSTCLQVPLTH